MGRSLLPLVLLSILVLHPLVLVPAPLALSARLPPGAAASIGRYAIRSKPAKIVVNFLKQVAKDVAKDLLKDLLLSSGGSKAKDAGDQESSANTVGLFVFDLSVGTSSPQNISGVLDITSQLVWSQCAPCGGDCLPPPAPTFEPNSSATFAGLPCSSQTCQQVISQNCSSSDDFCGYISVYGDDTNTTGYLATDTFTFGAARVPGLVFGCSSDSVGDYSGASGVFGFSQGNLSLVSQLNLSWFSYFWASSDTSDDGSSSVFEFGFDNPTQTSNSRSTPLLTNDVYPDLYFVNLTGVRVDDKDLAAAIPPGTFDMQANGSGGVFLSTTVPVTFLEEAAYNATRKALASSIKPQPVNGSALGLDLCYTTESLENVTVPALALVFDGADAVMKLERDNYFYSDNETGLDCLTILPSLGGSLLGSLLQTGRNMTYDIAGKQLIFDAEAHTADASPARSLPSLKTMTLYLAVWALLF